MSLVKKQHALKAKYKALHKQMAAVDDQINEIQDQLNGDKPVPEIAKKIASQRFSFGVAFTRKKELRKVKKPGLRFMSDRRFATKAEATTHGRRFQKKHGHQKFEVVRVNKRANAWVNPRTGKTNPVVGLD
jgi:hypothetical protein